jgi:hypothetical protein
VGLDGSQNIWAESSRRIVVSEYKYIIRRVDEDGPYYGPFDSDDEAVAYSIAQGWTGGYEISVLVGPED